MARPFAKIDIAEAVAMYQDGALIKDLACHYGCTRSSVYAAFRRHSVPLRGRATGPIHAAWKGGVKINTHGYKLIWVDPSGPHGPMITPGMRANYVAEHRVVMAEKIGRPLLSSETVHHKDGDKLNNAPDNLQLLVGQHGNGAAFVCGACGSHDIVAQDIAK